MVRSRGNRHNVCQVCWRRAGPLSHCAIKAKGKAMRTGCGDGCDSNQPGRRHQTVPRGDIWISIQPQAPTDHRAIGTQRQREPQRRWSTRQEGWPVLRDCSPSLRPCRRDSERDCARTLLRLPPRWTSRKGDFAGHNPTPRPIPTRPPFRPI